MSFLQGIHFTKLQVYRAMQIMSVPKLDLGPVVTTHLQLGWIRERHLDNARQQALSPTLSGGHEAQETHKSELQCAKFSLSF